METITETLSNGNTINYKIVNGTAYHIDTNDTIVNILENARNSPNITRLRLAYGDTSTGRDWGETTGINGYVGRSTGPIKIPLIISKINSLGGIALLDHCIIKIERKYNDRRKYKEIYRHKNYHK